MTFVIWKHDKHNYKYPMAFRYTYKQRKRDFDLKMLIFFCSIVFLNTPWSQKPGITDQQGILAWSSKPGFFL